MRRRSWWGWGYDGEGLTDAQIDALGAALGERLGLDGRRRDPPPIDTIDLAPPRISVPATLRPFTSDDRRERVSHAYGKSYRDVVRALQGRIDHPPDLVARPRDEGELSSVLDWCAEHGVAVIPFGGGSSVVGGVEPDVGEAYPGAVTVDMGALDAVLEVDRLSQTGRVQGGVLGPALEDQLRPHGFTLRHFPQSFECSSLGGWIATRAGGHFATGPTHIDDLVESLRVLTPAGVVETRRLPSSGAGPSPDRLFVGSEGTLGVITEAWMRLRRRPRWRAGGAVRFVSFEDGAEAVRSLGQSGLSPSNCRLLDPVEALVNGAGDGSSAVLVVGFESADHPLDAWAARARELVSDHGGEVDEASWRARHTPAGRAGGDTGPEGDADAAEAWRSSFLRGPYIRDGLVRLGAMCETFETACTWDRLGVLHDAVTSAVRAALVDVGASRGFVTCRFTHAYPDGVAPYFTVVAPARPGTELEQWDGVKTAASEAVLAHGGTITHHHAVGRDHRPWYDRQRPDLFAAALRETKAVLDPAAICNPGVLVDVARRPLGSQGP
ncbi:MAG TPA: FAD-binding oxidoreductase [Acidimicrobiaceae bacterium]|nr:FAD-binding oxidoreductase [Acidimicrobiaceae bacterium]